MRCCSPAENQPPRDRRRRLPLRSGWFRRGHPALWRGISADMRLPLDTATQDGPFTLHASSAWIVRVLAAPWQACRAWSRSRPDRLAGLVEIDETEIPCGGPQRQLWTGASPCRSGDRLLATRSRGIRRSGRRLLTTLRVRRHMLGDKTPVPTSLEQKRRVNSCSPETRLKLVFFRDRALATPCPLPPTLIRHANGTLHTNIVTNWDSGMTSLVGSALIPLSSSETARARHRGVRDRLSKTVTPLSSLVRIPADEIGAVWP